MSTRVKLVGLLAIPVIALVAVAFAFGFGHSTTDVPTVEASTTGTMALTVKDGFKECQVPVAGQICVVAGGNFILSVEVTASPTEGFFGLNAWLQFNETAINFLKPAGFPAVAGTDASGVIINTTLLTAAPVGGQAVGRVNSGGLTDGSLTTVFDFTGNAFDYPFQCKAGDSKSTVTLVGLGVAPAFTDGAGFVTTLKQVPANDSIVIHCQVPPTATPTNTPTETSTPTPTNTPVSQPPFVKSPSLQNLWLTRQGDKIPPVQCVGPQGSDDTAAFEMGLGVPIAATDPKGSGKVVDLGAFEFEVHYDAQKVCVEIQQAQASITMTCFIQDDVTKPVLEGVARIGCVTVGKKLDVNGVWNMTITALGGQLGSQCVMIVQEAPVGIPTFPFPVKGAMIVTGPPGLDLQPAEPGDQNCVGTTGTFGWVSIPGIPVPAFDNVTGNFGAIIPCNPPNLGTSCSADGLVFGTFFQEPTTLDMAINATFTIDAIVGGNPVPISDGVITGARKSRFALDLATIIVRPQPDVYSQAIPNQDNGVVVQLNNQKCALADQQGHPIAHFSCGDADVTIRYLEGDVEPDCTVNTLDTQSIAFRWGASKGTLLYSDRFNLEPFGTQSDDDIDIKDLQAVYGRVGSTCANPHPDQPAVNPKA